MHPQLSLDLIASARQRIAPFVRHTPVLPRPALQTGVPGGLQLKLENLQITGSFKVRGAFNTLLQAIEDKPPTGVVTASGGNHGLAVAYAAARLGLPATVYLPHNAGPDRAARIARWGARVIMHGESWDDADESARDFAVTSGLLYVHPFADESVIAGQATLGLELLADLPELDCVLIAIGGGGLIAGVSAAIKQARPGVRIIGVEPVGAASMHASVARGQVTVLPRVTTIANTLAPRSVAPSTLALTEAYVDEIVLVDDSAMVDAMEWLWLECNQLVEPAGAAVIAALHHGSLDLKAHHVPVAIICGGNAAAEPLFSTYRQAAALTADAVR
ncbi:MAG: threonine/serine dehydratase [Herpetosiphon sp.]